MRVAIFCHSLISDWDNRSAHFLRGIAGELQARGIEVALYEPRDAASMRHLLAECGPSALAGYVRAYPALRSTRFDPAKLDLDRALRGADLVLVHDRSEPDLVRRVGEHRAHRGRYQLLFHDTYCRPATAPEIRSPSGLAGYDGVLAGGRAIRDLYLANRWVRRAWVWQCAADVRRFRPLARIAAEGDVVWIGNWGDETRWKALREFLIGPVRALGLRARVHGVGYPDAAQAEMAGAGIDYPGWLPNYEVPRVLSRYRLAVHIPCRPHPQTLPGVPAVLMFEALACGVPVVSAPWQDPEGLFTSGEDFLMAQDGEQMTQQLRQVLEDPGLAAGLAARGFRTIRERHTCAHRVDELLAIYAQLQPPRGGMAA